MAAIAVMGSWKMRVQFEKTRFVVMITLRRSYRSEQGELPFHLVSVVLDVANVVEQQTGVGITLRQHVCGAQTARLKRKKGCSVYLSSLGGSPHRA
jgi:hypothetical protein